MADRPKNTPHCNDVLKWALADYDPGRGHTDKSGSADGLARVGEAAALLGWQQYNTTRDKRHNHSALWNQHKR